ncbi:MAG: hypothetical protein AAB630_02950 [Patescibacteria group bacterium]
MENYVKNLAVSGVISAVFFAGAFYFVYDAESAKYEEKKTAEPTKQYEESIIAQINSEVAQTMENFSREEYALAAQQTPPQEQEYAPIETTETLVYDDAKPQPQQAVNISAPEQYVATATPSTLQIPLVTIPSFPALATIPNITPIAIRTTPSPQPAPTIQQAPIIPVQPKPAATQPRTTVS